MSLRDLAEIFLERGVTFTYEAVREWERRFTPLITKQLRTKRHGQAEPSWYVDETDVRVTTDGHASYPRAVRETLGDQVAASDEQIPQ